MLLEARGLSKRFPGTVALDAVDFALQAGEVHALLGENGAGKSTLIKCLTGTYRRDGGDMLMDGELVNPGSTREAQGLGIGTVYQEVNLLPNLTVAENLLLGRQPRRLGLIRTRAVRRAAREMLAGYGLNLDVDRSLGDYPVSVQQIVAIARAVALSGRVLILDEPTASLDEREVQLLFDVIRSLRDRGLGIIFISHFLDQVFAISDRITVLRNGRRVATEDVKQLDRVRLVNLMLGRDLLQETARTHRTKRAAAEPLLRFEKMGRKGKIAPFDLVVHQGEVIGMAGLLGSGRTESAEVLFGAVRADQGAAADAQGPVNVSSPAAAIAAGLGFAPEDRKTDGIIADLSVHENITLALQANRGWARPLPHAERLKLASHYVEQLDIRTSDLNKPVGLLSGGNQQKVILARWLAMNPRFLILDEPTRGIDVGAHAEVLRLIGQIVEDGTSVLVISSEIEELVAVSDRVIVVRDRSHVAELVNEKICSEAIVQAIAGSGERVSKTVRS